MLQASKVKLSVQCEKNNNNFSSFGKKMHFGSDIPPLFTSLFLACRSSKAKNQEAAHLL